MVWGAISFSGSVRSGKREGWKKEMLTVRGRKIEVTYRVEGPFLREGLPTSPCF